MSTNTSYTIGLSKPAAGLVVSGSQVVRATGTNTSSSSDSVTFNDVFYYGYTNVLGAGIITQLMANSLTASTIQSLTSYKFGGKTQTLTGINDSPGNRVLIAYLNTYGNISNIVLNSSTSILGAFLEVSPSVTITTISGISAIYNIYVAVADNSYPGSNTLAIT